MADEKKTRKRTNTDRSVDNEKSSNTPPNEKKPPRNRSSTHTIDENKKASTSSDKSQVSRNKRADSISEKRNAKEKLITIIQKVKTNKEEGKDAKQSKKTKEKKTEYKVVCKVTPENSNTKEQLLSSEAEMVNNKHEVRENPPPINALSNRDDKMRSPPQLRFFENVTPPQNFNTNSTLNQQSYAAPAEQTAPNDIVVYQDAFGNFVAIPPNNLFMSDDEENTLIENMVIPNEKYSFLPVQTTQVAGASADSAINSLDQNQQFQAHTGDTEEVIESNQKELEIPDTEEGSTSSSSSGTNSSSSGESSESDNIFIKLHPTPMNSEMEENDGKTHEIGGLKAEDKNKERIIKTSFSNEEESLLKNITMTYTTQIKEEQKLIEEERLIEKNEQKQQLDELIRLARDARYQL